MMRVLWAIELFFYFVWEFLKANAVILKEVLTPGLEIQPSILKVPVDLKSDWGLYLLSNLITLTPGTLTLKIAEDRSAVFIHMIYSEGDRDERVREIKDGFERRIQRILGAAS